jgi:hypothetical protein
MTHIPHTELSVPPLVTGKYQHYKGDYYEVVGVALHSEDRQPMVVYRPFHDSPVPYWVRPYEMFIQHVVVDGQQVPRFKKVDDNG